MAVQLGGDDHVPGPDPAEHLGAGGERIISAHGAGSLREARLLEPALGCLKKLAKWEMPAKPPHYVRLPLNEESREKLNSRLRHLIRELLLKRRRCRSDQEKYTL